VLQVCKKKFTQSGHLLSHTRMHTNHRPYECKYCNKSFTQSGHLNNHERLHSGERPYQCNVCNKRFTQSGHLSNHMRLHSGERPFELPCPLFFSAGLTLGASSSSCSARMGGIPPPPRPAPHIIKLKPASSEPLPQPPRSDSRTDSQEQLEGGLEQSDLEQQRNLEGQMNAPLETHHMHSQLDPRLNLEHDPQLNPRLSMMDDPQMNPQFNPQFDTQFDEQFDSDSEEEGDPETDSQTLLDIMAMPETGLDT
ncbi:unnamed protein product, partial [Ixodes pacificus]